VNEIHARLLATTLAASLAACGGAAGPDPAALDPVEDLAAALPAAAVHRESSRLVLGDDFATWGSGRSTSGFSTDNGDDGFRWSLGPASTLTFFSAERRSVPMTFRAFPFRYPEAPDQEVEVVLNGERVASVDLHAGSREYAVRLPGRAMRAGENRLAFHYAYAAAPRDVSETGSDDSRSLAVAWEWIDLGSEGASSTGEPRATRDELYIPAGVRLDFFPELPAQAALLLDGLAARGDDDVRLEVRVQRLGDEERVAGVLSPADAAQAVDLASPSGLARVSLTAVPGHRPLQATQGLVLRHPAVAVPRSTAPAQDGLAAEAGGTGSAAGVALAGSRGDGVAAADGERRRPNLILYMVDTLRADHLGAYGYRRPVSPRLDAFAADATLFETTVAQAPWTRPSVASVLTGLTPRVHGINRPHDGLAADAVTLAEVLAAAGYRTAALVANPNIAPRFHLGQGFESYELLPGFDNGAPLVTEWAEDWIDDERDPQRPFFLYLHTVEPHAPYTPEEPYRSRFAPDVPRDGFGTQAHIRAVKEAGPIDPAVAAGLMDLYDAEIAANDAAFGDLLDGLAARGLMDDTVVVFIADHGEEFLEHGQLEHAKAFYRESIEVPWVVRFPDLGHGRRIAAPAQQVDVMPTLLGYLGLPVPPAVEGLDLMAWVAGEEPSPEEAQREIHSYLDRSGFTGASVRVGDWRWIEMVHPLPTRELFDLRADPAEHRDVGDEHPVRAGWMDSRIRAYRHHTESGQLTPSVERLDKELRQRLRALGYI